MPSPASASTSAAPGAAMSPGLIVLLLSLLLGLQPVTTDLYLPALPALTEGFGASMPQAQLTLTALLLSFGFLGATGYLVFRDDLFTLVRTRNADMQIAYEDRIARLRSEIDKISSRQILDQVAMDDKVERLLSAQAGIADRQKAVAALIDKAESIGLIGAPGKQSMADPETTGSLATAYATADGNRAAAISRQFDALTGPAEPLVPARTADGKPDFKAIAHHLIEIDAEHDLEAAGAESRGHVAGVVRRIRQGCGMLVAGVADHQRGDR